MCRSSLLSVSVSSSSRSWFERSTRRLPLPNASSESCGPYISKVRKQFEIENFPTSCLMLDVSGKYYGLLGEGLR